MLIGRLNLIAALSLLAVACSGGGAGGSAADAGPGGSGGSAGAHTGGAGSGGVAGGPTDAGLDAASDAADAAPLDPSKACDLPLKMTGFSCKSETAKKQPALGGAVPDGIFDRTLITSPVPAATCDITSSLLLQGGLYQLQFSGLGGPDVSGGSVSVDEKVGRLIFTTHCGENNVGYFYEWNAADQTLTLFPDNFTGWVYELRK